ncbi:hypothetical protein Tsp_10680, partial [Trichinella spiralis]
MVGVDWHITLGALDK